MIQHVPPSCLGSRFFPSRADTLYVRTLPFECDGDDHELGAGEADPLAGVEEVRVQQHLDPEGDER